ncbi:MAG TPA: endonuclease/exonuclease/phosphatase family protein [Burkholderiales bacterium]|jgi:endonuclease/exonuclease/phosphatase family metal-dependent hydrolase|nr:endonuclease/exonuclease/phosphatase family protein [Burkholderiales bacterium]
MTKALKIATYNIHKGFSAFNRRMAIHELRERLRGLDADVVFLQEVLGSHETHALRYEDWPPQPQYEFLADTIWSDYAYGKNAVYNGGHHGNAVLSRFPIVSWHNYDVSAYRFERRGLLHCEIEIADWTRRLHCVCVHFALLGRGRERQLAALRRHIEQWIPPDAPLIVAGDFNDWRGRAGYDLMRLLNVREVFELVSGESARSFPAALPLFRLDRIYVRGFGVRRAQVHHGRGWARISDHAVLTSTLALL